MRYGELIELILLRVNGGELGGESAVQLADVQTYAAVAINDAVRQYVLSGVSIDPSSPIFSSKSYTPIQHKDKIYKVQADPTHSWSGALAEVYDSSMTLLFPSTSISGLISMEKSGMKSYYPAGNGLIYLICPEGDVTIRGAYTADLECDLDQVVPAPQEILATAIELAVNHFKEQRMFPQVISPAANDINANTSTQQQ